MASVKHFINDPTKLVLSSLKSLTLTNPSLTFDEKNKIVYRALNSKYEHQVSIISGGGSGHEPSFAGFVGDGLLAASVSGTIFASPSSEQVRSAILGRVPKGGKVLVVVMNYTGDILNFGMAVEKAKGQGVDIEMVVVGDDVGVGREKAGKVGRRGIAGTCLVLKIAGALAATGKGLKEVADTARLVAKNMVSVGASLSHVHVPGRDTSSGEDALEAGEVELGMGIHNEPGCERLTVDFPSLVTKMLAQLLDSNDKDRAFCEITKKDQVVLMINNLGGVSPLEIGGITNEVSNQLETKYAITPVRVLAGTFMTSLNGLGFSITLLKVNDSILRLLDAPTEAVGWNATVQTETWNTEKQNHQKQDEIPEEKHKPSNIKIRFAESKTALTNGLHRVIRAEPEITKYDTVVGDGDCGVGLKRGAEALLEMLNQSAPTDDLAEFLDRIVHVVESTMDGTSGALYTIFLNALVKSIRELSGSEVEPAQAGIWAKALERSLTTLSNYTPAQPGDRTLIDALNPFVSTLSHTGNAKKAAAAAEQGAEGTKKMKASLGRSVYIGGENWQEVPDPGAYGLGQFLSGLANGLGG